MVVITAPFTQLQVDSLNDYQVSGVFHEFTCGMDHPGDRSLVATQAGWICPQCGYTQCWAHEWMANDAWRSLAIQLRGGRP